MNHFNNYKKALLKELSSLEEYINSIDNKNINKIIDTPLKCVKVKL